MIGTLILWYKTTIYIKGTEETVPYKYIGDCYDVFKLADLYMLKNEVESITFTWRDK